MTKVITSVYDKCTGYMDPVTTLNSLEAIRGFKFALSQKDSTFGFSPADFDLYELGIFNTSDGSIIYHGTPRFLCNGALLLAGDTGDINA